MIKDHFYETASTISNTDIELTDVLTSASITPYQGDIASPYYMGYILNSDFPRICDLVKYSIDDGLVKIEPLIQNHSWGFLWQYIPGAGDEPMRFNYLYTGADNARHECSSTAEIRFINSCTMADVNYQDDFDLMVNVFATKTEALDENMSFVGHSSDYGTNTVTVMNLTCSNITLAKWQGFLDGTDILPFDIGSFNVGSGAERESITPLLYASDFQNDNNTAIIVQGLFTVFFQIAKWRFKTTSKYYQNIGYSYVLPFLQYKIPAQDAVNPEQNMIAIPYRNENNYVTLILGEVAGHPYPDTNFIGVDKDSYFLGDLKHGHLQCTDRFTVEEMCTFPYRFDLGISWRGISQGRMMFAGNYGGRNHVRFYFTVSVDDINKMLGLINKINLGAQSQGSITVSNTYTSAYSVTLFRDDNIPTNERLSDAYSAIETRLMEWQKPGNNIKDDDYTIDKMPEDVTPEPDPSDWEDKRHGTVPGIYLSRDGAPLNFVTPWLLTAAQAANFGKFLWENLFLPDPDDPSIVHGLWQNFMNALGSYWQTGSFDPASTLDFVVSLMYFPFDVTSAGTNTNTYSVYFGTGILGLTVSSSETTYKGNSYNFTLSGGTLDLSDPGVKASMGVPDNFRGLANTSACIYLPFCGTYEVPWCEIKDSKLRITYAVDLSTGACTAYVSSALGGRSTYVLCATGVLGFAVPLSATNANRLGATILGDLAAMSTTMIDKGQSVASSIVKGVTGNIDMENEDSFTQTDDSRSMSVMTAGGPVMGSAVNAITTGGNIAQQIFSKPAIGIPLMRGGAGWHALNCPREAYVQVRTPEYIPDGYHGHTSGWPLNAQKQISGLSGYTECINVDTSTLTCSNDEKIMIKQILETGFYA